jgi:hypothetical protein
VRLSPLGASATVGLLYQPRMIDGDYGAVGGMRIGRVNRSTRRKPAPVPLCPPQIPHDLTWVRTRAAAVGSRRITAPFYVHNKKFKEELIAYFPLHVIWYDTDRIENTASNISSVVMWVFVASRMYLPSRCLATIGGTHRQQDDLISLLLFYFFNVREVG